MHFVILTTDARVGAVVSGETGESGEKARDQRPTAGGDGADAGFAHKTAIGLPVLVRLPHTQALARTRTKMACGQGGGRGRREQLLLASGRQFATGSAMRGWRRLSPSSGVLDGVVSGLPRRRCSLEPWFREREYVSSPCSQSLAIIANSRYRLAVVDVR